MRVKEKSNEDFKPVTIEITFETEMEMKDFRSILNYTPVCDLLSNTNIDYSAIRKAIPCEDHEKWVAFTSRIKGEL